MDSQEESGRRRYLTEEAEESLTELLEAYPEFSEEAAQAVFRAECEKFEELFRDSTDASSVREMALHQTGKRLKDGDLPESVEQPGN